MNQAEFEKINKDAGRGSTLEEYALTSDEQIQQGNDPPDGGEWKDENGQGMGIVQTQATPKIRFAYRNWCEWEELTLPSGATGIYVRAHAPAASRF